LKDAHGRVPDVVLHHLRIADAIMNVMRGVLEDASGAKRALVRTVNEVLADRRQILLVKSFLTLQFMLSMGKPTSKAIA